MKKLLGTLLLAPLAVTACGGGAADNGKQYTTYGFAHKFDTTGIATTELTDNLSLVRVDTWVKGGKISKVMIDETVGITEYGYDKDNGTIVNRLNSNKVAVDMEGKLPEGSDISDYWNKMSGHAFKVELPAGKGACVTKARTHFGQETLSGDEWVTLYQEGEEFSYFQTVYKTAIMSESACKTSFNANDKAQWITGTTAVTVDSFKDTAYYKNLGVDAPKFHGVVDGAHFSKFYRAADQGGGVGSANGYDFAASAEILKNANYKVTGAQGFVAPTKKNSNGTSWEFLPAAGSNLSWNASIAALEAAMVGKSITEATNAYFWAKGETPALGTDTQNNIVEGSTLANTHAYGMVFRKLMGTISA